MADQEQNQPQQETGATGPATDACSGPSTP